MKNLIMAYGTNSKFEDFYKFVVSLRRHCRLQDVDVAVFINAMGEEFSRVAVRFGVTLVPVENVWNMVRKCRVLNSFYHAQIKALSIVIRIVPGSHRPWLRDAYRVMIAEWVHPQAGRWLAFNSFLKVNSNYQTIMTSDLRDVVFQASPFEGLDDEALHVFEQDGIRFGDGDNVDTQWYRIVYGKRGLERVAGRTTLCSGTVLAGRGAFLRFLELMDSEVQRHPRAPLDQAMFNEVINKQFDGLLVRHNLSNGPVLTLTGEHAGGWEIRDGRVVVEGRIVPVIHMYDRHQRTKELYGRDFSVNLQDVALE